MESSAAPADAPAVGEFRFWSRPVVSWALYDFANTIFSLAIITRYFNEWVINDQGKPDWWVSVMGLFVAIALIITMPVLGALADRLGQRKPFLVFFTLLCVTATALLPLVNDPASAMVVAGVAIFAFQSALAHYDPMLAAVAPREAHGTVSGFGVGLGYVGAILGLLMLQYGFVGSKETREDAAVLPLVHDVAVVGRHFDQAGANQQAFLPTALLFLVFALPCFLWVREGRRRKLDTPVGELAVQSLRQLRTTIGHARRYRNTGRFLLARFLYADAVLVLITYMTVYASRVSDFSENTKTLIVLVATLGAILGAFLAGKATTRYGPRRPLVTMLLVFAPTLFVTALVQPAWILWVAGPLVGATMGTMWTADRVFMMRLSPPAFRGEFFSIYNLIGKASSGIGPLVFWAGTIYVAHDALGVLSLEGASRLAIIMLALVSLAGVWLLWPLSDVEPDWTPAERGEVDPLAEPA